VEFKVEATAILMVSNVFCAFEGRIIESGPRGSFFWWGGGNLGKRGSCDAVVRMNGEGLVSKTL